MLCVVFRVCVCDARGGARRREAARGGARRRVVARGGAWWRVAARGGAAMRRVLQYQTTTYIDKIEFGKSSCTPFR